jgi:hypothetical protein
MLKRSFTFKMKQLLDDDPEGYFEGQLAVYNVTDLGGDVIVPGAFSRSIQAKGSQVPLLWQHDPSQPIGVLTLIDGPNALSVQGQLLLDLPMAESAYTLLKNKIIRGLSIGYDTIKESFEDNVRVLKELRLWEGSIVTFPMNEQAMVTSIKSLSDIEGVLRSLRDASEPDVLRQLRGIDLQLKRLLRKDSNCQCDCPECLAGNCADCSDPTCEDQNCEGSMAAQEEVEQLAALKSLATSLKSLVA